MSNMYADFEEEVYKKLATHFDEVLAREGAEILKKGYGTKNKLIGHSGLSTR